VKKTEQKRKGAIGTGQGDKKNHQQQLMIKKNRQRERRGFFLWEKGLSSKRQERKQL